MKFIKSPVGIAVIAITALIAAGVWLYKNWDTVKAKAAQLGAKISGIWTKINTAVTTAIAAISSRFPALGRGPVRPVEKRTGRLGQHKSHFL